VRWIGLGLIFCFACLYCYGQVHFSRTEVEGIYEQEGLGGRSTIQVRDDGTFSHIDGKEVQSGTWHLVDAEYVLYDTGIEFDGGSSSSRYANEYRLMRRGFRICWEVYQDQEYWCKKEVK
jgi:hypothetical protein